MSRYSFIDENINSSGKQCFCIDVNSTNSPFVNVSQASLPQSQNSQPVSSPAPVDTTPKKIDSYQMINKDQNYLLTPQVIGSGSERERNMIETINNLMTQTYSNISTQKDFQAVNAPTIDTIKQKSSDLMGNDTQVGKKTLRKSSSNLNLFEGFETPGCTNVCKPSNKSKHSRVNKYRHNKSNKSNDNLYLVIIILAFLLCSWFKK
jgi:hypothetical protein